MRIVSWNMAHRANHGEAWGWLMGSLNPKPDIILAQECFEPKKLPKGYNALWEYAYPNSRQQWGTALVTSLPMKASPLLDLDDWLSKLPTKESEALGCGSYSGGWVAAAEIELPSIGVGLVASVHNPSQPFQRERLRGIDISEMKLQKSKDLWLLDVLFYFLKKRLGTPLLVGGDFNYSRLLDQPYERGNNEFFDRIEREGFQRLHKGQPTHPTKDVQTFFRKRGRPHQLDYLYADASIAKRVRSCWVVSYKEVEAFSDHAPLVVDL